MHVPSIKYLGSSRLPGAVVAQLQTFALPCKYWRRLGQRFVLTATARPARTGRFAGRLKAACAFREALVVPEYSPAVCAELPNINSETDDDTLFIRNLCFAKSVNVGRARFLRRLRSAMAVTLITRKCVRTAETECTHKYD